MSHYDYEDSPINTPSKKVTGKWMPPSGGGYQATSGDKPKGAPPKSPASSSRVVQPAGTAVPPRSKPLNVAKTTSKVAIMQDILDVLKEIRDELKKSKEPVTHKVAARMPSKTFAGSVQVGMRMILEDGAVALVKDKWPLRDYAVPTTYFVTELKGSNGPNCFSLPNLKEVDVI